jgi:hypothetical protein
VVYSLFREFYVGLSPFATPIERCSHVRRARPLILFSGTCFLFCSRLLLCGFLPFFSFDDVLLSDFCCMTLPYQTQLEISTSNSRQESSQSIRPFSIMCLFQVLETCSLGPHLFPSLPDHFQNPLGFRRIFLFDPNRVTIFVLCFPSRSCPFSIVFSLLSHPVDSFS